MMIKQGKRRHRTTFEKQYMKSNDISSGIWDEFEEDADAMVENDGANIANMMIDSMNSEDEEINLDVATSNARLIEMSEQSYLKSKNRFDTMLIN